MQHLQKDLPLRVEDGIAKRVSHLLQLQRRLVVNSSDLSATSCHRKTIPSFTAGFTLIELLVVIAIIGILSAGVAGSMSYTRGKAANVSIKTSLKSIRPAAEMLFNELNRYNTVCTNANILRTYTSAGSVGGGAGVCNHSTTAWAASAPLKLAEDGNTYWCVDSTGTAKGTATPLGTARVCP